MTSISMLRKLIPIYYYIIAGTLENVDFAVVLELKKVMMAKKKYVMDVMFIKYTPLVIIAYAIAEYLIKECKVEVNSSEERYKFRQDGQYSSDEEKENNKFTLFNYAIVGNDTKFI